MAILGQGPAANLDRVPVAFRLARSGASPQEEKSKLAAKSLAATESAGKSLHCQEANLGQDDLEDAASLDQDDQEQVAILDQDDRERVDRNRDLPDGKDETDDYRANCCQDERQDRRCNTRFQRVRGPLFYLSVSSFCCLGMGDVYESNCSVL